MEDTSLIGSTGSTDNTFAMYGMTRKNLNKDADINGAKPLPLFSFLLPTRNRTEGLYRFLQSVVETTNRIEDIEVALCVDEDDPGSHNIAFEGLNVKTIIVPPGATLAELLRNCFSISTGRYVMFMNDDVILRTRDWDLGIHAAFRSFGDDIGLVYVNDLLFRERLSIFPVLSRQSCLQIGVCPAEYRRYRIDNHIFDTYNMLALVGYRRIVYLPDVVFEHLNFQTAPDTEAEKFVSEEGKVYVPNPKILKLDSASFESLREQRKQDALELASLIERLALEKKLEESVRLLKNVRDINYQSSAFVRILPLSTVTSGEEECDSGPAEYSADKDSWAPPRFAIEVKELESICSRQPLFQSLLIQELSFCLYRARQRRDISKITFCENLMTAIKSVQLKTSMSSPVLIDTYKGYNIAQYLQEILIVPRLLGPLNLADRNDRDRPGIVAARNLEEAKTIIDEITVHERPEKISDRNIADVPAMKLVAETASYNLILADEVYFAVAKSLGPTALLSERLGQRDLGTLLLRDTNLVQLRAQVDAIERNAAATQWTRRE